MAAIFFNSSLDIVAKSYHVWVCAEDVDNKHLLFYVKPAQNYDFELVTIIGYVHNLFTQPNFDAIV